MRLQLLFVIFIILTITGCERNRSFSTEITGRWKAVEMMNPPEVYTNIYTPVPESSGFFAEFNYDGTFRGHYYYLDGWENYKIRDGYQITLFRNNFRDSIRIGFDLAYDNSSVVLSFPYDPNARLKLVR
jgi:hypothetical protein